MKKPGVIYQILDERGYYGIAYNSEQSPAFTQYNKVFIHMFHDDLCQRPVYDEKGEKKLVTLKHISKISLIGYTD